MPYRLSILIPARNETIYGIDLLAETVKNVLENTSENCEVVCVLDGYKPDSLVTNPRVTYIHHSKSIGQRAATNEAAKVAQGDIVMKLDAHCALSPNFDEALLVHFPENWCVVPSQMNLLVFTWKCKRCGWVRDQSPKPDTCGKCNSQFVKQVKHWFPRDGRDGSDVGRSSGKRNTMLRGWRFDTNLEYSQWGELYNRQEGNPYPETMSLLGACWAMHKKLYFDIEPCDERMGSWGQMGTEISCKVWLSGNEIHVNPNCWFAHFFRVGGLWFPYPGGGMKERAMSRCRELFLNNKWEGQIYPLSWLIDRFRPPDWETPGNPTRALVDAAGITFAGRSPTLSGLASGPVVSPDAGNTEPSAILVSGNGEEVAANAQVPLGLQGTLGATTKVIVPLTNEFQVGGVTASSVIANEMIQLGNVTPDTAGQRLDGPSVKQSVSVGSLAPERQDSIPVSEASSPQPAPSLVDRDLRENSSDLFNGKMVDGKVFSSHDSASSAGLRSGSELRQERDSDSPILARKCALYYSCLSHDPVLELAARNNLKASTNGHELGVVTLNERIDFGDWQVVVQREKSGTTMHYQILEGLRRSRADYVFLCESDVFYHPSHFDFTPPRDDTFYYNTNVWRVRYQDGHAVRTANLQQVSGICANRLLLLQHYQRRVEWIEANGGTFDVKRMAYEPGTRGKFGDECIANWESPYPNIDITGHGQTLTTPHFSVESFRNPKYAQGWQETDEQLPGWPKLAGRVQEFLEQLANG